jgi:hypothetical protein
VASIPAMSVTDYKSVFALFQKRVTLFL